MQKFATFFKEDGGGSAGAGLGAAPTNTTAGVAGAGDNTTYPQKVVPVGTEAQKKIRRRNQSKTFKLHRKILTGVNLGS